MGVADIASSPSSRNAKAAPEKAAAYFGKTMKAVNGSGNMKDAQGCLASLGIAGHGPNSLKEKPFVEGLLVRSRGNALTIITSR
ncbi:MAG: hypothetical protein LBD55_04985 [Treponema sp.]|nr:hypothetical protein [Treponema sp.]